MKNRNPNITIEAVCYHYYTVHSQETIVKKENGQDKVEVRNTTRQEKIITHRDSESIQYKSCREVSENFFVGKFPITQLYFKVISDYENGESQMRILEQKNNFFNRNRNRDMYMDNHENLHLEGFTSKMLLFNDKVEQAPLLSSKIYIVATFIMLNWPYQIWFDSTCAYKSFTFIKRLTA